MCCGMNLKQVEESFSLNLPGTGVRGQVNESYSHYLPATGV